MNDCLAIPAFPDAATPNGTFVYATVGGLTGSTEKMDAVELEAATEEVCCRPCWRCLLPVPLAAAAGGGRGLEALLWTD